MLKGPKVSLFSQESLSTASHNTVGKQGTLSERAQVGAPSMSSRKACLGLLCSSGETYSCLLPGMQDPEASDVKNETNKTNFHRGHNAENTAPPPPPVNHAIEASFPTNSLPLLWHFSIHLTHIYGRSALCQVPV